jgi:hypothetical protein
MVPKAEATFKRLLIEGTTVVNIRWLPAGSKQNRNRLY